MLRAAMPFCVFALCAIFLALPVYSHAQADNTATPQNVAEQNDRSVVDGKWEVTQKKSVKGDKNSVIIILSGDEDLEAGRSPNFGMGCVQHTYTVSSFSFPKKIVAGPGTMFLYSIDDRPYEGQSGQVALDTFILISDPIPFLKSLAGGKKLVVLGFPLTRDNVEATFDIEGIENVLPLIQNECGWQ